MRDARETRFGIPHRGGAIAVNGTEVSLTLHEWVAKREVLRHTNKRVVDGDVAVRMVFAHHLADDIRRFFELRIRSGTGVPHAPQDTPLDRL